MPEMTLQKVFLSLFGAVLVFCALVPFSGDVAAEDAYFEALYDVPIMPGLTEYKDQALLFDKPDGRIASVIAASATLEPNAVERFYSQTLPQMGWEKDLLNQYIRDNSRLEIAIQRIEGVTIVRFALTPAVQAGSSP